MLNIARRHLKVDKIPTFKKGDRYKQLQAISLISVLQTAVRCLGEGGGAGPEILLGRFFYWLVGPEEK